MNTRKYVDLNGKQYSVTYRDDGSVSIWTSWEVINPRTVHLVSSRQETFTRSMHVRNDGKIGRKVLALAAQQA